MVAIRWLAFAVVDVVLLLPLHGQTDQNWFFGWRAGITFNGDQPQAISGMMDALEGSATVSDANGGILFYSNGIKVWNRAHEVMPLGSGLMGGISSAQAALIVAQPGHCGIFYLFTTSDEEGDRKLRYSVVDMSLDGGFGDVIAGMKNIPIASSMSEKVTSVRHGNGSDVWIFSHELVGDAFLAFRLSEQGLDTEPVVTHAGQPANLTCDIGFLKISHDGTRLLHVGGFCGIADLFDIDAANGTLTGWQDLTSAYDLPYVIYGAEFSPNDQMLYFSQHQMDFTRLIQLNRTDGTITELALEPDVLGFGALRLGADGRMYVAHMFHSAVDVIAQPDLAGTACGFLPEALALQGSTISRVGLPNDILPYALPAALDLGNDTIYQCDTEPFELVVPTPTSGGCLWQDGSTASSYTVQGPGTYHVTVVTQCGASSDTLVVSASDEDELADPWTGHFPNVFSPNNDGVNEMFPEFDFAIDALRLTVWNRWGSLVYETAGNISWNGRDHGSGEPCPGGTYMYQVNVDYHTRCSSFELGHKGTVTLVR